MTKRAQIIAILIVVFLAVTGCVETSQQRVISENAVQEPTPTPSPIDLPADEFSHESRLEWWYHNGHLVSDAGREFGFHFVVFKADDGINEPNLVAQLGILDVETGKHYEVSRAESGLRLSDAATFELAIANWEYSVGDETGTHQINAVGDNISVQLSLVASTPVMLHNEKGWLPTEVGSTYYYSWPYQRVIGNITVDGENHAVSGNGWFDHQWGDFFVLGKPAGWQWFAMQLGNGGALMVTESRGAGGEVIETYGTYMSPDHDVLHLEQQADGISIEVLDEWSSADTGGIYPSGWNLRVEGLDLELLLSPVSLDQEIEGGLPKVSTYWEGKVEVEGELGGEPISGDAYVELSGFVDPEPVSWR